MLDNNQVRQAGTVTFFQEVVSTGSTAVTINWTTGQKQVVTLNQPTCTVTFTAPTGVGNFLLRVAQDSSGARVIVWPTTVKWTGAAAPTLTAAASSVDIASFYYNGTLYYGVASLNFA